MIVSKDTNPERDVYFLGAEIINIIADYPDVIDFLDAYKKLNEIQEVSINLFTHALDWLFIIGAIDHSGKGDIKKCF